jgi:type II secretory pathway predicted ATPase ExeA
MYEAYFGLAKLPFCIAPDSRFYVDTAPHRAAIRTLKDRLQRGDEFVSLVGDFGAGKTTVGRQLLHEMDHKRHLAAELPRLRIAGDQLFDRVAEAFGTRRGGGLPPLGSVLHQLEGLVRDGRDALLLVDDAQHLDVGTLRRLHKLTALRVEGEAALRVCLVGHAMPLAFEAMQLVGRHMNFGAPVRVGPLDAAGTHEYILARLGRAGWRGRPAFGAATVAIHERCMGNPVRINRLCGHILLHLYMQGRDDVTADIVRAVDELLQAELRGEPATLALPPPATPDPHVVRQAAAAAVPEARLSGDALMTRLIAKTLPAMPAPHSGSTTPPPAPPRPEPVAEAVDTRPRRRGLPRSIAALALMAIGGVLWQAVLSLSARDVSPLRMARPAAATGLATLAEQAIAQSPTGAGPALPAASASLSPGSVPRSSPPGP